MPEPAPGIIQPDEPVLVQLGAVGAHEVWADRPKEPLWLVLHDLPVSVCADGANGLTRGTLLRARELGLHIPPGAASVPLAAYHPSDRGPRHRWQPPGRKPLGLDAPENGLDRAGAPVGWLVRGDSPDGYLQPAGAPAPGYYVSTTALQDPKWRDTDPRRYFDAAALPGFVLPGHDLDPYRVQLGDYALVQFGPYRIWAQAFDRGPAGKMLELSVAACQALGIPDCARSGGIKGGVSITILPGSRKMSGPVTKPQPIDEINRAGIAAARAVGLRIGPE